LGGAPDGGTSTGLVRCSPPFLQTPASFLFCRSQLVRGRCAFSLAPVVALQAANAPMSSLRRPFLSEGSPSLTLFAFHERRPLLPIFTFAPLQGFFSLSFLAFQGGHTFLLTHKLAFFCLYPRVFILGLEYFFFFCFLVFRLKCLRTFRTHRSTRTSLLLFPSFASAKFKSRWIAFFLGPDVSEKILFWV